MSKWFIRFFGLKGSWRWACRQMDKGHMVYRASDYCGEPGNAREPVKYRLDGENQRRIQWMFLLRLSNDYEWENANIFLSDFECTDWAVWA